MKIVIAGLMMDTNLGEEVYPTCLTHLLDMGAKWKEYIWIYMEEKIAVRTILQFRRQIICV